jgi:predicted metal-binding membrane protein
MSVAMMVPLVAESMRSAAARSLWARRHRAIAGFLGGYLSVWFIAGLIISGALFEIGGVLQSHSMAATAAGFGLAAAWQLTPAKRRGLWSCHRSIPMAPEGWRADRDAIRFGWMIGGGCVVSCWALMTACAAASHSLPAMLFATGVGVAERRQFRPNLRRFSGVTAVFAVLYGVAAAL